MHKQTSTRKSNAARHQPIRKKHKKTKSPSGQSTSSKSPSRHHHHSSSLALQRDPLLKEIQTDTSRRNQLSQVRYKTPNYVTEGRTLYGTNSCFIYGSYFPADEDRHHEFKSIQNTSNPIKTFSEISSKYTCAFLNSRGGSIYGGIEDTGQIKGIALFRKHRDDLRLKIDAMLSEIQPSIDPELYIIHFIPIYFSTPAQYAMVRKSYLDGESHCWFAPTPIHLQPFIAQEKEYLDHHPESYKALIYQIAESTLPKGKSTKSGSSSKKRNRLERRNDRLLQQKGILPEIAKNLAGDSFPHNKNQSYSHKSKHHQNRSSRRKSAPPPIDNRDPIHPDNYSPHSSKRGSNSYFKSKSRRRGRSTQYKHKSHSDRDRSGSDRNRDQDSYSNSSPRKKSRSPRKHKNPSRSRSRSRSKSPVRHESNPFPLKSKSKHSKTKAKTKGKKSPVPGRRHNHHHGKQHKRHSYEKTKKGRKLSKQDRFARRALALAAKKGQSNDSSGLPGPPIQQIKASLIPGSNIRWTPDPKIKKHEENKAVQIDIPTIEEPEPQESPNQLSVEEQCLGDESENASLSDLSSISDRSGISDDSDSPPPLDLLSPDGYYESRRDPQEKSPEDEPEDTSTTSTAMQPITPASSNAIPIPSESRSGSIDLDYLASRLTSGDFSRPMSPTQTIKSKKRHYHQHLSRPRSRSVSPSFGYGQRRSHPPGVHLNRFDERDATQGFAIIDNEAPELPWNSLYIVMIAVNKGDAPVYFIGPKNRVAYIKMAGSVRIMKPDLVSNRLRFGRPDRSFAPYVPHNFIGRSRELKTILTWLNSLSPDPLFLLNVPKSMICLYGPPGVGKSAFSNQICVELSSRYNDMTYRIDLQGEDGDCISLYSAVGQIIRIQYPLAVLPNSFEELKGLYESCFSNRRVLLVVDNLGQSFNESRNGLFDIIPSSAESICIIVTSRKNPIDILLSQGFMPSFPSLPVKVATLSLQDAQSLLIRIVPRISFEEAAKLAKACQYLPLALRIVGSMLNQNPHMKPSKLLGRITASDDQKLQIFHSVETQFSLAIDVLPDSSRSLLFCISSVFALASFSGTALEFISGFSEQSFDSAVSPLISHSLLSYSRRTSRYSHHNDLIRLTALNKAAKEVPLLERNCWKIRYARFYLRLLKRARSMCEENVDHVLQGLANAYESASSSVSDNLARPNSAHYIRRSGSGSGGSGGSGAGTGDGSHPLKIGDSLYKTSGHQRSISTSRMGSRIPSGTKTGPTTTGYSFSSQPSGSKGTVYHDLALRPSQSPTPIIYSWKFFGEAAFGWKALWEDMAQIADKISAYDSRNDSRPPRTKSSLGTKATGHIQVRPTSAGGRDSSSPDLFYSVDHSKPFTSRKSSHSDSGVNRNRGTPTYIYPQTLYFPQTTTESIPSEVPSTPTTESPPNAYAANSLSDIGGNTDSTQSSDIQRFYISDGTFDPDSISAFSLQSAGILRAQARLPGFKIYLRERKHVKHAISLLEDMLAEEYFAVEVSPTITIDSKIEDYDDVQLEPGEVLEVLETDETAEIQADSPDQVEDLDVIDVNHDIDYMLNHVVQQDPDSQLKMLIGEIIENSPSSARTHQRGDISISTSDSAASSRSLRKSLISSQKKVFETSLASDSGSGSGSLRSGSPDVANLLENTSPETSKIHTSISLLEDLLSDLKEQLLWFQMP